MPLTERRGRIPPAGEIRSNQLFCAHCGLSGLNGNSLARHLALEECGGFVAEHLDAPAGEVDEDGET